MAHMLSTIDRQGNIRSVSSNNVAWAQWSKVVPYFLWKNVPDNSWIVCPRYGSYPYSIQIGITGTCWYNEPPKIALARETHEESGLILIKEPNILAKIERNKRSWLWAVTSLKSCRAARGAQRPIKQEGRDNRSCKVGILIYSTSKNQLIQMIVNSALRGGLFHLASDNLIEVVIVPKKLAQKISRYPPKLIKNIDRTTGLLRLVKGPIPKTIDPLIWPLKSITRTKKSITRTKKSSSLRKSKSPRKSKKSRKKSSRCRKKDIRKKSK